jgi:hypothetical protein
VKMGMYLRVRSWVPSPVPKGGKPQPSAVRKAEVLFAFITVRKMGLLRGSHGRADGYLPIEKCHTNLQLGSGVCRGDGTAMSSKFRGGGRPRRHALHAPARHPPALFSGSASALAARGGVRRLPHARQTRRMLRPETLSAVPSPPTASPLSRQAPSQRPHYGVGVQETPQSCPSAWTSPPGSSGVAGDRSGSSSLPGRPPCACPERGKRAPAEEGGPPRAGPTGGDVWVTAASGTWMGLGVWKA